MVSKAAFFYKVKLIDEEAEFQNYVEYPTVIMSSNDVKGMHLPNLVIVNVQKFGGNSNTSLVRKKKHVIEEEVEEEMEEVVEEEIVKDVKKTFESFSTIIVDEAHHYPAETWKAVVDNFNEKQIVFLTATPYRRENPILENQKITFEIKKEDIEGKTIRKCEFKELPIELSEKRLGETQIKKIGKDITSFLDEHDRLESKVTHKAMVLVKASKQEAVYVAKFLGNATYYTSDKKAKSHKKDFEEDKCRILVVCGSLVEGYDNSDVSVCVILRHVRRIVIFTQFVGRCLRTSRVGDPVSAVLLSYGIYNQGQMWDQYRRNEIAENDPEE
jgi:superfamily II DNA or RNA helicase